MLEVWHKRGVISSAGYSAAETLRNAFEGTQRTPGWPEAERVQSSPKPDHAVAIHVDRLSRLHQISRYVPREDRQIVDACVLNGHTPAAVGYKGKRYQEGLAALSDALDRLARALGYIRS